MMNPLEKMESAVAQVGGLRHASAFRNIVLQEGKEFAFSDNGERLLVTYRADATQREMRCALHGILTAVLARWRDAPGQQMDDEMIDEALRDKDDLIKLPENLRMEVLDAKEGKMYIV